MSKLETAILTDTWVHATWNQYLQAIAKLNHGKAKGCYHASKCLKFCPD